MITEKTVIVLGAGASVDSGFPNGELLISKIIQSVAMSLSEIDNHYTSIQRVLMSYFNKTGLNIDVKVLLKDFHTSLSKSHPKSIDDFLFTTRKIEHFELIGKLAIVQQISMYEAEDNFQRTILVADSFGSKFPTYLPNWYKQLWHKIYEGCKSIDDVKKSIKNITFITFNYDRSLEAFLFQCIKHMYQLSDKVAGSLLDENLNVLHVYGQIGLLQFQRTQIKYFVDTEKVDEQKIIQPYQPIRFDEYDESKCNDDDCDKWLFVAKKLLFTYTDINPENLSNNWRVRSLVNDIQRSIISAQRILFFGFSFHEQNLDWFKLILDPDIHSIKATIGGTVYGMGELDISKKLSLLSSYLGVDEKKLMKGFKSFKIDEFYSNYL